MTAKKKKEKAESSKKEKSLKDEPPAPAQSVRTRDLERPAHSSRLVPGRKDAI